MGAGFEFGAVTVMLPSWRLGGRTRETWRAPKHNAEMSSPPRTYSTPAPLSAGHVALDEFLSRLEHTNRSGAEIVGLRFFEGLTVSEFAEAKDVSPIGKVWLYQQIQGGRDEFRGEPEG